jgi:FHA domain/Tetratricopeptide repeat
VDLALGQLTRCLEQDPGDLEVRLRLVQELTRAARTDEAFQILADRPPATPEGDPLLLETLSVLARATGWPFELTLERWSAIGDQPQPTAQVGPRCSRFQAARQGRIVLGRALDCDVVLSHPSIPRRQCEIRLQQDGPSPFFLTDYGGRNGTFVNRRRVQSCPLTNGDELVLGGVELRFYVGWRSPPWPARQLGAP